MPDEEQIPKLRRGPGWVIVRHEDTKHFAEVTQKAFDEVYSNRKWKIVKRHPDDEEAAKSAKSTKGGEGK